MSYYKARMYSPTLGRFMQTDPAGYAAGMNMYNYVNGDPINFADRSGLWPVCTQGTGTGSPGEIVVTGIICQESGLDAKDFFPDPWLIQFWMQFEGPEWMFAFDPTKGILSVTPSKKCVTTKPGQQVTSQSARLEDFHRGIPGHLHNPVDAQYGRQPDPGPDDGRTAKANPTHQALIGTTAGMFLVTRNGTTDYSYSIGVLYGFGNYASPAGVIAAFGPQLAQTLANWNAHDGTQGAAPVTKTSGNTTKCN